MTDPTQPLLGSTNSSLSPEELEEASDFVSPLRSGTDDSNVFTLDDTHAPPSASKAQGAPVAMTDKDVSWFLYGLMFVEGVGVLFPWNAFITVTQYFFSRLENSNFKGNFDNYFSFTFQFFNIVFLIVGLMVQHKVNIHLRIIAPLILQFLIFTGLTVTTQLENFDGPEFFYLILGLVILSGSATAFIQGALFGLGGVLPPSCLQAVMGGQGVGGVIVASLNVITLASTDGNPSNAAFIFFILSVVLILACLGGAIYLKRHPMVKLRINRASLRRRESLSALRSSQSVSRSLSAGGAPIAAPQITELTLVRRAMSYTKRPALYVFWVFTVTLSIFPAIADRIESSGDPKGKWAATYFTPVACFLMFNVGDTIGRLAAGKKQWPSYAKLGWPVLLRTVFIPLFILCNVKLDHDNTYAGMGLLSNDAFPIVLMLLMSITNGYFGTLVFIYGPSSVAVEYQEQAGTFLVLALTVGLLGGSVLGFGLKGALCSCNPFGG
eukprot:m.48165 g.48165  ORF g.48165 m.48165 type:complete len:495 (-) comp11011_c0_seq2:240-1724(-)